MRQDILSRLYDTYMQKGPHGYYNVDECLVECGLSTNDALRLMRELEEDGLADPLGAIGAIMYRLTPGGVLYAEGEKIAPAEARGTMDLARTRLLDHLADQYDEHGPYHLVYWRTIAQALSLTEAEYSQAAYVLEGAGLIAAFDRPRITVSGRRAVEEYRARATRARKLEVLSTDHELTPQQRGHSFERLLGDCLSSSGWHSDTNVRSETEENDIVVHKNRETYLVQCKWEMTPIGAPIVREMMGRLDARVAVPGLIFSMSGFADTAVSETRSAFGRHLILLWGPDDTEAVVASTSRFEELLDKKVYAARAQRRVLLDGVER